MMPSLADRFQAAVTAQLEPLSDRLIPVLGRLVAFPYPPEVVSLDFEVSPDGFTEGFPVRAFFMDAANCEHFVYRAGRAEYPCDVDPRLLTIDRVYDDELVAPFEAEDPGLDTMTLAGEALIPWFARCWRAAGGAHFPRSATIQLHDDVRRFDLVHDRWEPA